MDTVSIIGVGETPVGKHESRSIASLARQAGHAALADAGLDRVDAIFVGNMLSRDVTGQAHLGPLVSSAIGNGCKESVTVNAACGSGGAAVRQAYLAVASGAYDAVLAVGVEKMTGIPRDALIGALASAADFDREASNGANFAALNALIMQRYLHEHQVDRMDFAIFSEVAHRNAVSNPNARLRGGCSREDYATSRMVADPIAVHDASPVADGAAAVVLCSSDHLARKGRRDGVVQIAGSASATDCLSLQERADILWLRAAEESTRDALHQAGLTHADVHLFELHDAFTIISALSLESSGFTPRGTATRFARESGIHRTGSLPISTFGGLKARGHPVGASGTYQIVEATRQLRGDAGANQVPSASVAMTQSIGGSGATVVTHVLERSA